MLFASCGVLGQCSRCLVAAALLSVAAAVSGAELASILVTPLNGQPVDKLRRDRYECHNWSVEQTHAVPLPGPDQDQLDQERKAERVGSVITGAAVGAAAGSIIRGSRDHRDADDGALAGGVLGAIAGAVIGRKRLESESDDDEVFNEYFRALDACMSARGYALSVPSSSD